MTWNYRVVKGKCQGSISGELFRIKEAYYSKNKKKPTSLTVEAVYAQGETLEELKEDFDHMLEAFDKPVLKDKEYDE